MMKKNKTLKWTWFFDIDKTIYPPKNGMYQEGNRRINDFFHQKLSISFDEVDALRVHFMKKYGTSLLGSIQECNFNANEFLQYVHTFDKNRYLKKEPLLNQFLSVLPGEKIVFSNAPESYIEEILSILSIKHHFKNIYGIHAFKFIGKPNPSSYQNILRWTNKNPSECVLIDDMKVNCLQAKKEGFETIWIDENQVYNNYYKDLLFPSLISFLKTHEQENIF